MPKVLLIEDDLPLLRMYQVAFSRSGVEFLHAIDGIEGLELAKKRKPDLVLLDMVLPKKNGFEVLKELKSDSELKKIPVVCLTVLHQKEDMENCKHLGAEDYLVKTDILPEKVVEKVLARLKKVNNS